MKCRICEGEIRLIITCTRVFLECKACGHVYPISEYIDEIDEDMWSLISLRPSNRA